MGLGDTSRQGWGSWGVTVGWLQQQQEAQQAEPGAKEARMSSLPSRRAGDAAPSPLLLHPDAAGRVGELWVLAASREPLGVKGTLEMTWFGVQVL